MESIISVGNIIHESASNNRYRIISISDSTVSLCQMDMDRLNIIDNNLNSFMLLISENELIVDNDEDEMVVDISSIPESFRLRFENNKSAINEILNLYHNNYIVLSGKKPKPQVYEIIKKYSISKSSFWRLLTKYLQSGMKDTSLIDERLFGHNKGLKYHYEKKGGAKPLHFESSGVIISDEITLYFDEALREFRSGRHKTLKSCYDRMNVIHFSRTEILRGVPSVNLLPMSERPTYRQFYYYAYKHLTKQEKDLIKTSAQEQRNNKRLITSDALFDISGPGDLVEIDACEADVSLVSSIDPNKTIGRPIVYVMVDVYTRMIIAVSVAFDNNSYLGITNLFLNLAEDKHKYCERYGMGFDNDDMWQSNIIPRRLRVDRGSEFKGKEFDRVCNELGIEKQLVPGASGSLKGIVEQSFHQMHSKQNLHLEDYGLIEKRYDSEHHKEATLNIEQYTKMIINFVLTHNQEYDANYPLTKDMIQKKIKPIPCSLWKYGVAKYGNPRPITDINQYFFNMMVPVKAKLSRRGICYKNLYYLPDNDPILTKEMFNTGTKMVPFSARMDMRDVGHIYYLRDRKLIDAPLNHKRTANSDFDGMTMKQYEEYLTSKKHMDADGKIYNQELAAYSYSVNAALVNEVKKSTYSDSKKMRPTREIEKQAKSHTESINSKITVEPIDTLSQLDMPISKKEEPQKSPSSYKDFNEALEEFWDEN